MKVKIEVHKSISPEFEAFIGSIDKKVRKEIDLPAGKNINEFKKFFDRNNGILIIAKDIDSNNIVGTISAARSYVHYICKSSIVSGEDPVKIDVIHAHEIFGAYVPPEYRRYGIYSKLRDWLEKVTIESNFTLYSIPRYHPDSKFHALAMLKKILNSNFKHRRFRELEKLRSKGISREEIKNVEPLIGMFHPDAVSVFHRWSKLVEQHNAELLGYWVVSFSPLFIFTPSKEYIDSLNKRIMEMYEL
jgi:hypothetical protein